jgi:hypothetical protein
MISHPQKRISLSMNVLLRILPALLLPMGVSAAGPVQVQVTEVPPVQVEVRGNVLFADFGQDAFGNLKIEFPSNPPAAGWTARLGEKLAADGTIDRNPGGSVNFREIAFSTQPGQRIYQLDIPARKRGRGVRSIAPTGEITPFRYAEIEGAAGPPPEKLVLRQLAVNAPFDDTASEFNSSDPTLNAVWNLCKHTMKAATAFGVFIDGERERTPYEGDTYIAMLSYYACNPDPRVVRATFEYLLDHPTWPTEWSLMMPMIAYQDHMATGDPVLAADHFDALKGKLFSDKVGPDGLLHVEAIVDWPAGERDGFGGGGSHAKAHMVGPEVNAVANAFYYQALQCMAQLAAALHKPDEAQGFAARAQQVYTAFNANLFDPALGIYIDGEGSTHASLHANMFPLAFGLVPPERQAKVADFVQSRGMACSVYGAQFLLEALYLAHRSDAALGLMTAHTTRSWAHMIDLGSTMTLEAWDSSIKPNLTWNHAWGAAPANIISRYLLGVHPLQPGYTQILIAPQPASLKWMRGTVPTPRGPVTVAWQSEPALLEIDVPAGSTARLVLPIQAGGGSTIAVNGRPIAVTVENGARVIEPIPSGHYRFTIGQSPEAPSWANPQ